MSKSLGAMLPSFIREPLKRVRDEVQNYARMMPYHGKERFCPVCGKPRIDSKSMA